MDRTKRGFAIFRFMDAYDMKCSLQKSSSIEDRIWLGCDSEPGVVDTRMHLNQGQVAALLPMLTHFFETGELDERELGNLGSNQGPSD